MKKKTLQSHWGNSENQKDVIKALKSKFHGTCIYSQYSGGGSLWIWGHPELQRGRGQPELTWNPYLKCKQNKTIYIPLNWKS